MTTTCNYNLNIYKSNDKNSMCREIGNDINCHPIHTVRESQFSKPPKETRIN